MEMETDMIKLHAKDYAVEAISITSNGVGNWRDSDDISHEADTEVLDLIDTPNGSSDDNSCTTIASTEGSEPMNDSTKLFKFELSDADVDGLNKPVKEEEHQLPLPNEVAYTEKKEMPSEEEILASSNDEKKDSLQSDQIIYFVNQDAKISPSPVLQYVLDVNQPFDTVISCADGKIGAHRLVLASASPFIGDLFCSHDHRLGEVAMLVLPDVRMQTMKALLNFCYTGSMFFPKENEGEIMETMKLLLLGEFGSLSMKEVTVKLPPPPEAGTSDSNTQLGQSGLDPQPGTSSSFSNTGTSLGARKESLLELLSSSEDEDDAENDIKDEDVSSEDEDDNVEDKRAEHRNTAEKIQDEEMERLDLANNYLKYKKDENTSVNYIIQPRPPGVRTKQLQCYHCPGAFKSMETLTNHLENNHGVFLQSRNLNKSEFNTLTSCGYCKIEHKLISSANSCIGNHGRTRCYICLEIFRIKDFETHIKTSHGKEKRNGKWIVKCTWCDAGISLHDPIDNKPMSGHCFANHFPGGRNTKVTMMDLQDDCVKEDSPKSIEFPPPTSVCSTPSMHDFKLPKLPSTFSTPKSISSSTKMSNKNVPAVLALLHKASLKRKLMQETESESEQVITNPVNNENPKKRARLDSNGKRLQVAKRTGKPVGHQVYLEALQKGTPAMKTTSKSKGIKVKMVSVDVTKLPKIYVNINYPKTFILNSLSNDKENRLPTVNSVDDSDCSRTEPSAENAITRLNTSSDVSTEEEAKTPETKRRHSDSRCSLPCL